MSAQPSPECDRLWREHSEVSQKSFRLEERLRNAELCQDNDLANALARRLVSLMWEQNRTSEAFVEHQASAHPQKGAAGSITGRLQFCTDLEHYIARGRQLKAPEQLPLNWFGLPIGSRPSSLTVICCTFPCLPTVSQ